MEILYQLLYNHLFYIDLVKVDCIHINMIRKPLSFVEYSVLLYYDLFLNKRVKYIIESATTRYPMIVIKLAMVEAIKG